MMGLKVKLSILAALVVAGAALASAVTGPSNAPPIRGAMRDFSPAASGAPALQAHFSDGENAPLSFADFKGKVVLVNLWATWCAPCIKEMPALQQLKATMANGDFDVVTISEDKQGRQAIDPFMEKNNLTGLSRYVDPDSSVGRSLKIRGLPTTLLLDRDGHEIGRLEGGADWASDDAKTLIDWALKREHPAS